MGAKPKITTAFVGQFEHAHAEAIAKELEDGGIAWYFKQAGGLTQIFFRADWGVRLFADAGRKDEVRAIVERVAARFRDARDA